MLWHGRLTRAMKYGFVDSDRKRSFTWFWCAANEICGTESIHALRNEHGMEMVSFGTEFHKNVCCDQPDEAMRLYRKMIQWSEPPRP